MSYQNNSTADEFSSEFADMTSSSSIQKLTSSPWISDDLTSTCTSCHKPFHDIFNRRHHCRLCGKIFCHSCSAQRALIPPSSIVLVPKGGKKVKHSQRWVLHDESTMKSHGENPSISSPEDHPALRPPKHPQATFEQDPDPDCMVTYLKREKMKTKSDTVEDQNDRVSLDCNYESSLLSKETCREPHVENHPNDSEDSYSLSGTTSIDLSHGPQHFPPVSQDLGPQETEEDVTTLIYGKGLEERIKLAREPLRVCRMCFEQLQHVQEELRLCNSNAMRYNAIDPNDARRLLNSPLAFTLGHEIRKAAYTLNNLLPLPKRMGAFVPSSSYFYGEGNFRFPSSTFSSSSSHHRTTEECQNACQTVSRNMSDLDGVRIPARLLERAKGVAVMTVIKGGFGFAGLEFGTGLVVARLGDGNEWSPPCAIGTAGVSWGALVGAQISDHVFLLMTDAAVDIMSNNEGSFQLGADIGVAAGPLGRSLEADIGAASGTGSDAAGIALAPIYTYSLSKGLYAGISLDGKVIVTRHGVNERFYGHCVDARSLLRGDVPTPPAAQPLYDALKRCHVYAGAVGHRDSALRSLDCHPNQKSLYYQYNMNPRNL